MRAATGERLHAGRRLLKLEVDIDGVALGATQAFGKGFDSGNPLESGLNRLVHDRIAAGTCDFSRGDRAVGKNSEPHGAYKRAVLGKNRRGLLPLAEETVVNDLVIPAELRRIATRRGAGALARRGSTRILGGVGRC